ncbi:MAG: DUF4373 domain-containing protein [Dehalococcoidales bacterium]|nr:DUF4373 domain-containing protein [Dehalococcoidales bacterium]
MGRKQRNTVDYFPHDVNASMGDTLTVLQDRFGNDGYAFWFKLLEKLASTEGHYIDCSSPSRWKLLLAKLRVSELTGVEIMNILVEMQAIDGDLWKSKLIWCQNLVDNVAEVYQNRRRPVPLKPVSTPINPVSTPANQVSTPKLQSETPQSKVEESKVEEKVPPYIPPEGGSVKGTKKPAALPYVLPDWIDKDTWAAFVEVRKAKKAANTTYALQLIIKELALLKEQGDDPIKVLNQSISNSWKGVFALKDKDAKSPKKDERCATYFPPDPVYPETPKPAKAKE